MGKNKGGRPRKFETPEQMQESIEAYFQKCDSSTAFTIVGKGESQRVEEIPSPNPYTIEGLCNALGMTRQSLLNYSEKDEYFDIIKDAKAKVLENLSVRALRGTNHATVSIFMMKNNYGYTDKHETEHSGSIDIPSIKINIVKSDNPIANSEKDIV